MPLIFGKTSGGVLVPVLVDAEGNVLVQNLGWIGAAWQKNPLALGYSGDKSEQIHTADAAAGTNTLNGSNVPAGEIWIVEAASVHNLDSAFTKAIIFAYVNGVAVALEDQITVAASEYVTWSGAVTLSEGDKIFATFSGVTLNDDIYLRYTGRRIDIDQ